MGFSEDDRIRSKNRKVNEALDVYDGLKAMGYDNAYILKYAQHAIDNSTDSCRNEVYHTMISIVGSFDETDKGSTDS